MEPIDLSSLEWKRKIIGKRFQFEKERVILIICWTQSSQSENRVHRAPTATTRKQDILVRWLKIWGPVQNKKRKHATYDVYGEVKNFQIICLIPHQISVLCRNLVTKKIDNNFAPSMHLAIHMQLTPTRACVRVETHDHAAQLHFHHYSPVAREPVWKGRKLRRAKDQSSNVELWRKINV